MMITPYFKCIATILIFLLFISDSYATEKVVDCFKFEFPSELWIKNQREDADFIMLDIGNEQENYISMYFGNHPNFPVRKIGDMKTINYENKNRVLFLSNEKIIIHDEILVKNDAMEKVLLKGSVYVHAWTRVEKHDAIMIARNILDSLNIYDSPECKRPQDFLNSDDIKILKELDLWDKIRQ